MQSKNYSEEKNKRRLILILIAAAICGQLFYCCLADGLRGFLSFILWVIPYVALLLSVSALWKIDKRHIGVFVFLILLAIRTVLVTIGLIWQFILYGNYTSFGVISFGVIFAELLLSVLLIVSIVSFCKGFSNCIFRWNISRKVVLYIAFLFSLCESVALTNSLIIPCIALFCAEYLLFRDFSFQPLNDRAGETKKELEQLQEAYDQGYLSEEVYQKRRQDIINRI